MSTPSHDSQEPPAPAPLVEPQPRSPHDPYIALRNVNYRRYFTGNAFSLIGSNMTTITVGYELYHRTGSNLAMGMVGLVQVIPILLLALPAGHFVDRFNRKTMILTATAVQIVLWILMGLSSRLGAELFPHVSGWFGQGDARVPIMLTLLLINGMCRAVNQPAKQSLLPMLLPPQHFPNGVTWNASLFETSNVLGPMASGIALAAILGWRPTSAQMSATWGFSYIYWANALFQLINCINIARVHLELPSTPRPAAAPSNDSILASIKEGIRFVYGQKIILSAISLDMFAVLLGGVTALLPAIAEHVIGVGPVGYAILRAAPSVGAVLMAMILAHSPPMKHAGRNLLWAVTGFGIAIIVFGLSRNFYLSAAALFAAGMCDNISVVVRHSLVQLLTPDAMRGRVNSVNTVFISSSNELGEFESGFTAHLFQRLVRPWSGEAAALVYGPMIAVVAGGAGTIAVVLAATRLWPQLAHVQRLDHLRPGPLPEPAVLPLESKGESEVPPT